MSSWNPCKRKDFIKRLRGLGFKGVYSSARHQFMIYGNNRLTIPSNNEYSVPHLKLMLREVEEIIERSISAEEWNKLP